MQCKIRKEDFEKVLQNYDVVLHSQDTKTLEKSLRILKPGGKLVSISGPPDPDLATEMKFSWPLKMIFRVLSHSVRSQAKRLGVNFSFLFMKAQGEQLGKITALIDSGIIRPVIDKMFPFEATNEALRYVEAGRAKGKVVITVKRG